MALDDKLIASWTGHPHLRVIDNSSDFDNKIKRVLDEISLFLGEPEPYEIERKFLIEYPDIAWLNASPHCERVEIVQTYLKTANPDEEIRVRQRGVNGSYIYIRTLKRKVSDLKRVEVERRITEREYLSMLMEADTSLHQIRKDRYCFTYENQYLEIDTYPFSKERAIVEIELSDENAEISFPEQIKVIREVTNDDTYRNKSLAKTQTL